MEVALEASLDNVRPPINQTLSFKVGWSSFFGIVCPKQLRLIIKQPKPKCMGSSDRGSTLPVLNFLLMLDQGTQENPLKSMQQNCPAYIVSEVFPDYDVRAKEEETF